MGNPVHIYRQDRGVLRVAHVVPESRSEGPGLRFCLWLQGCELRCKGCCNLELFDFNSKDAVDIPVSALADELRGAKDNGVEGITLLGGEPFHQAPAAAALAAAALELGLGVMVFTGYELDALRKEPQAAELLERTDLLVAGPYVAALKSIERPWVGSDNQEVHLLTSRYHGHPDLEARRTQSVHVQLVEGELRVSGWPGVVEAARPREKP